MVAQQTDILLTGCTGFVGRFVLRELAERFPEKRLAVIIRSSGKKTAQQRWTEEILGSSLFGDVPHDTWGARVQVIDAALEHLETTTHHLTRVGTIIHCAANIKHYDPYEALERDNVGNVERILRLAESLQCSHLVVLSTCYVHPHATGNGASASARPAERIGGAPKQADFYNDYCYTKWLGEEVLYNTKTTIPNITIARLSCVGGPQKWELAVHPAAAQAHLGVLSLALRGFLETLAWRPAARISTIPVDVVATAIVDAATATASATAAAPVKKKKKDDEEHVESTGAIRILQLCPHVTNTAYHISLPLLVSVLQTEFGLEDFRGFARADSTGLHLAWWKQVVYSAMARGQRAITLHQHVQDFVSTFTDEDIRFASTLPADALAPMTEQEVARMTCAYAVRILHHRQLAKGVPMSRLDQFWFRVANREPVQICWTLREGVPVTEWPALQQRLWAFFLSFRKCGAGVSNASPLDGPITWKQLSGHSIPTYFAAPQKVGERGRLSQEAAILEYGLHQAVPERLWHITPIRSAASAAGSEGAEDRITHLLFRFDHAVSDGAGAIPHLAEFRRRVFGEEEPANTAATIRKPRALSLWMDIWMGIVYMALLAVVAWSGTRMDENSRSKEPTVATATHRYQKPPNGRTYTTELLWKLTNFFTATTRESRHLFAVPAVTDAHRPAKNMLTNAFVPVLLPVESGMSEEAFAHRCMLLRSRSVRFLSWCLVQLVEWGVWDEIRDALLGKVRCIVSSLQMGNELPQAIKGFHVATTTPAPIPYSITAVSSGEEVYLTARSHNAAVPADKLLGALEDM